MFSTKDMLVLGMMVFALFLGAGFVARVLGEAAGGDEQAHVIVAQHGHERAQARDVHGLIGFRCVRRAAP